jgi:hypothetical protein
VAAGDITNLKRKNIIKILMIMKKLNYFIKKLKIYFHVNDFYFLKKGNNISEILKHNFIKIIQTEIVIDEKTNENDLNKFSKTKLWEYCTKNVINFKKIENKQILISRILNFVKEN